MGRISVHFMGGSIEMGKATDGGDTVRKRIEFAGEMAGSRYWLADAVQIEKQN